MVRERAHDVGLPWDAGGRRVKQHYHSRHQDGQHSRTHDRQEVVEGWLCNDELLWDPGVRLKVVMGHGRHDDHIHDDEGNGFSLKLCNKKVFYSVKLLLFL